MLMTDVTPDYPTLKQLGPKEWESLEEVEWSAHGFEGIVPVGFVTDGASTPRVLWALFPPLDKYSMAALVHDYLYQNNSFGRKACDKVFLELMVHLDVARWKRQAMYRAVRLGGWRPYKKYKRNLSAP